MSYAIVDEEWRQYAEASPQISYSQIRLEALCAEKNKNGVFVMDYLNRII